MVTVLSCSVTGLTSGTTYYFTVRAVNAVGSSASSPEASAAPGLPLSWSAAGWRSRRWTGGRESRPHIRIRCRGGGSSGDTSVYQGGAWTAPTHINTTSVSLVSCASSSMCVAVNQSSNAIFDYNGSAWSADPAQPTDNSPLVAVSCAAGSDGFCMLMDNDGNTFTRGAGGTWAAAATLPTDTTFEGLTCLSDTSCLALTAGFNTTTVTSYTVYAWNGRTWSAGASLPSVVVSNGDSVRGFSCATSTVCVALFFDPTTPSNVLYTYDGSVWTASSLPGGFSPQRPVACSPGGNCFAVGTSANGAGFFQYINAAWSAVPNGTQGTFQGSPNAMSCGSASFCGAVPGDNTLNVFDGTSWVLSPVGGTNQIQAVSCATSSFCAGVDNGGDYVTYAGTALVDTVRRERPVRRLSLPPVLWRRRHHLPECWFVCRH